MIISKNVSAKTLLEQGSKFYLLRYFINYDKINKKVKSMKNLLVFLLLLVNFVYMPVFSQELETASKFVRVSTNAVGYNFVAKKIAQKVVCRALNKNAKGDYKVSIDSFSGVDLKKGKFRGATIKGENISVEDELFISMLKMKTLSDFNYIKYNKKPIVFVTDIPMSYEMTITEDDFNKTLASNRVLKAFTQDVPLVRVDKVKAAFEEDKIRFSSKVRLPFCKPITISVSSGVKVVDGKIVFDNIDTSSIKSDLADSVLNYMNSHNILTKINLYLFDNATTLLEIKNIKICKDRIYIDGNVTLNKVQK